MKSLGETFALALFLLLLGGIVAHCTVGCTPAEQTTVVETVESQAAVAQYKLLLADCRAKGKAARDYAVYAACADALDAELCRTRGAQCADGGAK